MAYKQIIKIEGKSIDDIFKLPCIHGVFKDENGRPIYRLTLNTVSDRGIAVVGEYLCEDNNGKWHLKHRQNENNLH